MYYPRIHVELLTKNMEKSRTQTLVFWLRIERDRTPRYTVLPVSFFFRVFCWARLKIQCLCITDQWCCYKCMLYTSRGCRVRILIVKAHSDNLLLQRYIFHRSQAWSEFIVTKRGLNSSLVCRQNVM